MSEALARVRSDSILGRPARAPAAGSGVAWRLLGWVRALPRRVYLGAALSALLAGIGVNALFLQHERRPAPLFAPAKRHPPAPSSAPVLTHATESAVRDSPSPTVAPPPLPPAKSATASEPRPPDQIGDLLRGELPREDQSAVMAVQGALATLGYPVKADGLEGPATEQALRDFERAHGLPLATELTPQLVKQLTRAARSISR